MRKVLLTILDRAVTSTGTAVLIETSPSEFGAALGMCDKLSLQCIADQCTGNMSGTTLTVAMYHSNDGENWIAKTASFCTIVPLNNATVLAVGTDPGTTPTLAFVKFVITGTMGVAGGTCHLKLLACARDDG